MNLNLRVAISADAVAAFNRTWPCSKIEVRDHYAEFATNGDLIDHDFTEDEDGAEVVALIDDALNGKLLA